jgi:hypothetical protein
MAEALDQSNGVCYYSNSKSSYNPDYTIMRDIWVEHFCLCTIEASFVLVDSLQKQEDSRRTVRLEPPTRAGV